MNLIIIISIIWILGTIFFFLIKPNLQKNISEKKEINSNSFFPSEILDNKYKINIIYNNNDSINTDNYADMILNLNDIIENSKNINKNILDNQKAVFIYKKNINFNKLLNITTLKK